MAPNSRSSTSNSSNRGYGAVLQKQNRGGIGLPEESKYQSFSDSEGGSQYDMEQMRLIVSSLRQQHNQQQSPEKTTESVTMVPPFTPDAYYKQEYRQQWRRTILGILGGLLAGFLLTKGWSLLHSPASSPGLNSHWALAEQFDYIVVGGGPSGIVAATRLAQELPTAKIVLLESGSATQSAVTESVQKTQHTADTYTIDPTGKINTNLRTEPTLNKYDIPLMWSGIANTQRRMESFHRKADPHSSTFWPVPLAMLARGLGGCGLHNAMIYIRSLPSCFEKWNLNKWTFDQMLPVYESLETYQPRDNITHTFANQLQNRGREGPIRTTPSGPQSVAMGDYFVKAALASGLPLAGGGLGFNKVGPEERVGAGYYEFNIRNGVRHSVANAMLGQDIPFNLLVLKGRTVTQILWSKPDGSNRNLRLAVGVTYLDHGSGERAKVLLNSSPSSEVILATGALMTPQILWNSGIGDGGSLVDLQGVGKNLQDHPVLGMAYQITTEMTENAPQMYAMADEMEDYKLAVKVLNDMEERQKRTGKSSKGAEKERDRQARQWASEKLGIAGTAGFSSGAFLKSPWADTAPDIQLTVFPRVIEPHQPKSKNQMNVKFMRARAMLVTVALLEPEARYEVRPGDLDSLVSDDGDNTDDVAKIGESFARALQYPLPSIQLPKGQSQYLTDKDVKRLAWGMEQVRQIMQHPPMSNITTTELYPGDNVVDDGHILDQYIRTNHLANSHWVGTTKMGRDDDPLAVLDENLRVRGVEGLRVFDAGAIPSVPNGNTHSTICAVASRGVDLILEERGTS